MKIGVLTFQDNYQNHLEKLKKFNIEVLKIKREKDLDQVDGLIISENNSNKLSGQIEKLNFTNKIISKALTGMPIFGTGAGILILAKKIKNNKSFSLDLMDIVVENNYSNKDFQKFIDIPAIGEKPFKAVFVKPVYITEIAPNVGILGQLDDNKIVFVRQGNYLAASFSPELNNDLRVYQYFLKMVKDALEI